VWRANNGDFATSSISPQTGLNTLNKNELKPWQKKGWGIPEAMANSLYKKYYSEYVLKNNFRLLAS